MAKVNGGLSRRQLQSATTREEIVRAAAELFTERGYVSTTIEAISTAAGVAVQTIYNSVGNKVALLNAVLDFTVAGPQTPASVPQFMRARTDAAMSVDAVIEILADWFVEVNGRSAGVFALIRQAGAIDPEVAELERKRSAQRLKNYEGAAARVRALGGLGAAVSDTEAAAAIWTIAHPDVYRALTAEGGMSQKAYRRWLDFVLRGVLQAQP